jgi:hypothetical protein
MNISKRRAKDSKHRFDKEMGMIITLISEG